MATHLAAAFWPDLAVCFPDGLAVVSVGTGETEGSTGVTALGGSPPDAEGGFVPERRILSSNKLTSLAESCTVKYKLTGNS